MALKMKRLYLSWDAPSFAVFESWVIALDVFYNTDRLLADIVPQGLCELIRALAPEVHSSRVVAEKFTKAGNAQRDYAIPSQTHLVISGELHVNIIDHETKQ